MLRTIAPICGGGVQATQPDLLMPIRPRAVRNGIAQWWWRLNRGQLTNAPDELWRAYARVFGGRAGAEGGGPSRLQVVQCSHKPGTLKPVLWWPFKLSKEKLKPDMAGAMGAWSYALFQARGTLASGHVQPAEASQALQPWIKQMLPESVTHGPGMLPWPAGGVSPPIERALDELFGGREGWPHRLIAPGLEVSLTLRWPRDKTGDAQAEADHATLFQAIELWLLLGQFGGRGSRGMGAFELLRGSLNGKRLADDTGRLESLNRLKQQRDSKLLGGWDWRLKLARTSKLALQQVLQEYRDFRQYRLQRFNPMVPSRSLWPDADAHRIIQGLAKKATHRPVHPGAREGGPTLLLDLTLGGPVHAEFRLASKSDVEPATVDVAPWVNEAAARFPSPLRLRAVRRRDGSWASLALVMPHRGDLKGLRAMVSYKDANRVEQKEVLEPAQWQGRDNATGEPLTPDLHASVFSDAALHKAFDSPNCPMPEDANHFANAMRAGKGSAAVAFIARLHGSGWRA